MIMKVFILSLIIAVVAAKAVERQEISGRIIGGIEAAASQWPFVASVHHAGSFICGGALFSVQWVLTAAECVNQYTAELPLRVYIAVGGITNTGLEPGKVEWPLDRIVVHPDFDPAAEFPLNNIALLHCITPVPIGGPIQPIQLPFGTEIITAGTTALFAGWGGDNDENPVTKLQYVENSSVMDTAVCSLVLEEFFGKTELCTEPDVNTTACKYDLGSPLYRFDVVYGTILLGINSYAPCNIPLHPTVFTNIPAYIYWISTVTA